MVGRHPFGFAVIGDACIVHENIDALPTAENFGDGGGNILRLRHIAAAGDDFDAGAAGFGGGFGHAGLVDIDEKEMRAFFGKLYGDGAADA